MKILHTSDWHVGKVLKGQPRLEEQHRRARRGRRDRPRPSGPTWSSSPATSTTPPRRPPDATKIVTRALSRAARHRRRGRRRSAATTTTAPALDALRPWAEAAGIMLRGTVRDNADEHCITGATAGGERVAAGRPAVPVPALRGTRGGDVRADRRPRRSQTYADHIARLIAAADRGLRRAAGAVNLARPPTSPWSAASTGGGEREAHTIDGLRGAGDRLPGQRALRRARPPAPRAAGARPVPGALLRQPARGRLRRGGERAARWRSSRSAPTTAAQVRDVPVTGGRAAAHRARAPWPSWPTAKPARRLAAGASSARRPGPGCARTCRSCCRARWRSASTREHACPTSAHRPARRRQRGRARPPRELFGDYLDHAAGTTDRATTGVRRTLFEPSSTTR